MSSAVSGASISLTARLRSSKATSATFEFVLAKPGRPRTLGHAVRMNDPAADLPYALLETRSIRGAV